MFARIIGNKLIQISDNKIDGYREIIEGEKPQEQEGYYISYEYKIINNKVHKIYSKHEIIPTEEKNN